MVRLTSATRNNGIAAVIDIGWLSPSTEFSAFAFRTIVAGQTVHASITKAGKLTGAGRPIFRTSHLFLPILTVSQIYSFEGAGRPAQFAQSRATHAPSN
jgi:hypothetical protein